MNAFAAALATLHADPHLAIDADWREGGQGPAKRIRVVRTIDASAADALQKVNQHLEHISVRVADVPTPRAGDTLTMDPAGAAYVLVFTPSISLDHEGLANTILTRRA